MWLHSCVYDGKMYALPCLDDKRKTVLFRDRHPGERMLKKPFFADLSGQPFFIKGKGAYEKSLTHSRPSSRSAGALYGPF